MRPSCTEMRKEKSMDAPEKRLSESIHELLQAILVCHAQDLRIPALILVYVGIDFVASLDRPDPAQNTTRADFLAWLNKYLLPESDLKCEAIDLYAARCGWVHTYTSKSSLVQEAKAKEICHRFGLIDNEDQLQRLIKDPSVAVGVHFPKLLKAFCLGLERWERDFSSHQEHKARVMANSEKLLHRIALSR